MKALKVPYDEFESALSRVREGVTCFYIPTPLRVTVINSKKIRQYEKDGLSVLRKSKDNKGYWQLSGKSKIYIFSYQLYEGPNL